MHYDEFKSSKLLNNKIMKPKFKKTLQISCLASGIIALASPVQATTILFNFVNNGDFDGSAGVGETMAVSSGGETVTMTTVDILAPEYIESSVDGSYSASGNILSALNGDDVVTSIGTSNSVGVNNLSIGNDNYETYIQGNTVGTEGNDMNPEEAWIIKFDTDVVISEFNFTSIDSNNEFYDVIINGNTTSFGNSGAADDYTDPLNGLLIAAGTNITFAARGPLDSTHIRISSITVETVPEPSSTALLGLGGLGLIMRRRK